MGSDLENVRLAANKGRQMDGFYKRWIVGFGESGVGSRSGDGAQGTRPLSVRRCVRCASCMEETLVPRYANTWLIAQQKRCPCGACWNFLAPGKTVA